MKPVPYDSGGGQAVPSARGATLTVRRARSEFDTRRPDPTALAHLAKAVLETPAADGNDHALAAERLLAAVEYLDATTRVAPELINLDSVQRLVDVVEQTSALLTADDTLRVAGLHLSAAVSLALLGGRPASGTADRQDYPALVREARDMLGQLEMRCSADTMTAADIWGLRIVGDALDLAEQPDGRLWTRFADRCRPGSPWPKPVAERLRVAAVQPVADDEPPSLPAWTARLREVAAHTWNNVDDLAEVAALQPRRHRYGRGLIGEHRRARDLLNRRVWPLAAVLLGTVLLALFIAWGRPALEGRPVASWSFTIDLRAGEALSMSTALLAVAGAVAVALAVLSRPEPILPIRYEAARRWWTVGTVVILICGMVAVIVGVLEAISRPQVEWWATGLTIVVGLLHFVLAFGISQWQEEPRLLAWTERGELDSLQARLDDERGRLSGWREGAVNFWPWALALAGVFAGPVTGIVTLNTWRAGATSAQLVNLGLVVGLASLAGGVAVVRIGVEWRRLRLVDPGGRTAQISLAMPSVALSVLLLLPALTGLIVADPEVGWLPPVLLLAVYLVFLFVVIRSGWSAGRPTRFIRRRALQIAEHTPEQRRQFTRGTREG